MRLLMQKKKDFFEGVLGFVILIGALSFLFYAFWVQRGRFDEKVEYHAHFDEIQGVDLGTSVKIHGVDVGDVTHIHINPKDYSVVVRFAVKKELPLFSDAKIAVVGESLFGKKMIAIDPGTHSLAKPGHTFYNTQCASYSLESLIEKFLFSKKSDGEKIKA